MSHFSAQIYSGNWFWWILWQDQQPWWFGLNNQINRQITDIRFTQSCARWRMSWLWRFPSDPRTGAPNACRVGGRGWNQTSWNTARMGQQTAKTEKTWRERQRLDAKTWWAERGELPWQRDVKKGAGKVEMRVWCGGRGRWGGAQVSSIHDLTIQLQKWQWNIVATPAFWTFLLDQWIGLPDQEQQFDVVFLTTGYMWVCLWREKQGCKYRYKCRYDVEVNR